MGETPVVPRWIISCSIEPNSLSGDGSVSQPKRKWNRPGDFLTSPLITSAAETLYLAAARVNRNWCLLKKSNGRGAHRLKPTRDISHRHIVDVIREWKKLSVSGVGCLISHPAGAHSFT